MKIRILFFLLFFVSTTYAQIEEVLELDGLQNLNTEIQFKFGDRIFFETGNPNDLWVTDGTAIGTKKIKGGSNISNYYLIGDRCFLTSSNILFEINADSYVLEVVATASGVIKNILPFKDEIIVLSTLTIQSPSSFLQRVNPDNGNVELVFQTTSRVDAVVGFNGGFLFNDDTSLLYSDGTANGTMTILEDTTGEIQEINLLAGTSLNNQYVFRLFTKTYGSEPWITDGSIGGTKLLKDIYPGKNENDFSFSAFPTNFFQQNNEAYFFAYAEGFELTLFKTNGTNEGTEALFSVEETFDIFQIYELFVFQDEVYFVANSASTGFELWKTDGTLVGTRLVKDIWKGAGNSASSRVRRSIKLTEDYIYFNANDGVFGFELWRTDGTATGTTLISDFSPGPDWSFMIPLAELGDSFYFMEGDRDRGYRLYSFKQSNPLPEIPTYSKNYDWFESIGYSYQISSNIPFLYNDEMEVDQEDNVYLIGEFKRSRLHFYGSENFIRSAPTEEGPFRNFIASYNDKGQFRWAKEIGGNSFGKEQALAVDSENNVICGGVFYRQGVIGSLLMNDFNNRFFLAKLTTDGDLIWKKQGDIGQGSNSEINYIETDSEGNIYVGGCFTDFNAQFGPHQINAEISPSFFVAKYDKDGKELWLKHLPFPSVELHGYIKSLQVYNDNLYVVISDGDYSWSASCDVRPFDIQISVLDKEGQIVNEKKITMGDFGFVTDAKFSPSGYLHLIGMFRGSFEIENISLFTSCEDARGFVLKIDPNLKLIDAFALETSETYLQEIEFGTNGTYYLSGRQVLDNVLEYSFNFFENYENKSFVKKYDKLNRLIDERYFGKVHSDADESRPLIALDSDEKIILSDRYRTSFDTFPVNGSDEMKVGLIKFSLDKQSDYLKDDILENSAVLLYPIPAESQITLSSQDEDFEDASFQIFDASGRWITSPATAYDVGITTIDVNNLSAGVYFLQMTRGEQQFTKKFIKL